MGVGRPVAQRCPAAPRPSGPNPRALSASVLVVSSLCRDSDAARAAGAAAAPSIGATRGAPRGAPGRRERTEGTGPGAGARGAE